MNSGNTKQLRLTATRVSTGVVYNLVIQPAVYIKNRIWVGNDDGKFITMEDDYSSIEDFLLDWEF